MFDKSLSELSSHLEKSFIQKALSNFSSSRNKISFVLGLPSEDLLPLVRYQEAFSRLDSTNILQYSMPCQPLKNQIVNLMKKKGVACTAKQVFLTSGAQQAIMLLINMFVNKGENIVVDAVTYPGFIQLAKALQINLIPITSGVDGMSMEDLQAALECNVKPKLIYTIPDGHNPSGLSFTDEKRLKIINLSRKYGVPIIEDGAYGFINYENFNLPLRAYDTDSVLYIGTFSKILSPSARVGWIIVPEYLTEKLEILKETLDINTSTVAQHIISAYIEMGCLENHLSFISQKYKEKRDITVKALRENMSELEFVVPQSGFFIWGNFVHDIDTNDFFDFLYKNNNVYFLPGKAFAVDSNNNLNKSLRLSFSHCPEHLIEEGIKLLKKFVDEYRYAKI